ncbi:hypothetical protein SI65_04618 [Aspergillus cristatus]|uniref:Uncharacterized protein n=1 Tax=Aspergillus cristatus TaxID=573508 RepID=A0A1E3BF97_ASPCR|nr:hypothetical protein SI65_04618 [Aspergillus cristatus]
MSSANWSQLGLEIKSIILNNTGEFLDLHFLPGGISLLGTRGVSFLNRMGTSWMPSMGDSLGLKGDGKPGILGDYVTWSQGGTTIKCALTNYHDVRYGERLMGPSGLAFLKHLDQYGASPTSPPSENITLDLADMDHQASLAQSDNSMGAQDFFSPNKMFAVPEVQFLSHYGAIADPVPPGFLIARFDSLRKGSSYTKLGRTTDVTSGLCNGSLAYSNWKEKSTIQYDYRGQSVDTTNILEEFVVVSKKTSGKQATFSEDGDSGAFVLDHEGHVCGLLYGGVSDFYDRDEYFVNAGLVMNMPELINSMKLKTVTRCDNAGDLSLP